MRVPIYYKVDANKHLLNHLLAQQAPKGDFHASFFIESTKPGKRFLDNHTYRLQGKIAFLSYLYSYYNGSDYFNQLFPDFEISKDFFDRYWLISECSDKIVIMDMQNNHIPASVVKPTGNAMIDEWVKEHLITDANLLKTHN